MKNKHEKVFTWINYSFFAGVILACLVLTIVLKLNWLTFVSCVAGILYVVFLSDRNILNFIVGLVSSTTYIVVAFQAKLYGEVIFYLIVDLPMIFVSYFMWKKHMDSALRVEPRKLSAKQIIVIAVVSALTVGLYAYILKLIGGENVVVDAISTVVSFIATLLMAKRFREQWFMWLIVYVVSIIMWATTFDLLMLIMSCSCFVSCFIGFINWTRQEKSRGKKANEVKIEVKEKRMTKKVINQIIEVDKTFYKDFDFETSSSWYFQRYSSKNKVWVLEADGIVEGYCLVYSITKELFDEVCALKYSGDYDFPEDQVNVESEYFYMPSVVVKEGFRSHSMMLLAKLKQEIKKRENVVVIAISDAGKRLAGLYLKFVGTKDSTAIYAKTKNKIFG